MTVRISSGDPHRPGWIYAAGLVVLIVLGVAHEFSRLSGDRREASEIADLIGRQHALSQNIALLAAQRRGLRDANARAGVTQRLKDALKDFNAIRQTIIGDPPKDASRLPPHVDILYQDEIDRVRRFGMSVERLIALEPGSRENALLVEITSLVLGGMAAGLEQAWRAQSAHAAVTEANDKQLDLLIGGGAVLMAIALWLFAFHPSHRSLVATRSRMEADRGELRLAQTQAVAEAQRLKAAMEMANAAAWEVDLHSGAVFATRKLAQILGRDIAELADLRWLMGVIVCPADQPRIAAALDAAQTDGSLFDEEYRVTARGEADRWVRTVAKLVKTPGTPERIIGFTLDIDDRKQKELTLGIAKREAQEASRLKSEFIANMSHELRTPLNGVQGMCDLLRRTRMSETQQEYVGIIRDSGATLLALINDVLDLSKFEAGILQIERESFCPADVLEATSKAVRAIAHEKGLRLSVHCAPECRGAFIGDAKRIRQVMLNLAGNAAKFCESGQITLSVLPLPEGVRFQVEDTGPGISTGKLGDIFGRFIQGDGSATRRFGGAGLGLAISHDLVDLMGGAIQADSDLGEGSAFWFDLPLRRADEAAEARPPETRPDAAPPRRLTRQRLHGRALVVDDNIINRKVAARLLMSQGADVDTADDGASALRALDMLEYDLVLMDVQMPGLTGDAVIRKIRSGGAAYADISIIAITAHSDEERREQLLSAGADAFLAKPIEAEQLLALAERYLPPDRSRSQAS